MKSFNQFLQESYLGEEEARQGSLLTRSGKAQDFRNPKKFFMDSMNLIMHLVH
jgi:hypothetical protein